MKAVYCAILLAGAVSATAQSNIVITSLDQNGRMTWSDRDDISDYRVEWASSANGPWTNSWADLQQIVAGSATYEAQVPMFYRVVGQTAGTKLLMHMDGADGSTVITDVYAHAVSVPGASVSLATNTSKFGEASLFIDSGLTSGVSIASSPDLVLGTNDFTIDLWVTLDLTGTGGGMLLQCGTAGDYSSGSGWLARWGSQYDAVHSLYSIGASMWANFGTIRGEAGFVIDSANVEEWHHLAFVRKNGKLYIFFDGKLKTFCAFAPDMINPGPIAVGWDQFWGNANAYKRNIDELRILGYAKWTEDFTPPNRAYGR